MSVSFWLIGIPGLQAGDASSVPPKTALSQAASAQPKLAEQDVWKRWQRARQIRAEAKAASRRKPANQAGRHGHAGSTVPVDVPPRTK